MSDDLVAFLRARIDEDASWGLACSQKTGELPRPLRADHRKVFNGVDIAAETRSANLAEHIARHDPARALREVEAKREVIEEWVAAQAPYELQVEARAARKSAMDHVLRLLAKVYADHPDYREEWRP